MGFLDDKENKNINGAECERKQGNDEGRYAKRVRVCQAIMEIRPQKESQILEL